RLQHAGEWDAAGLMLARAARALELAGADFIVLCTNTMHKVAPAIEGAIKIPLLHIADPTARQIRNDGHTKVGLMGTLFTMEQSFYRERLQQQGLEVIAPCPQDSAAVHRIIYEELCLGQVLPESRTAYQEIMARLAEQGAQSIILGCTEISLLIGPSDAAIPLYDTTALHALAAADEALGAR
ncbi:MAG: amino acid racemase, partial [Comamonadaceae bacterium]